MTSRRVRLFGVPVDALTMEETIARIDGLLGEAVPVQHVVLNAAKAVAMAKDDALRRVVAGCQVVNADGASVVLASRLLGRSLPERVAGIDLFVELVAHAATTGRSVFLLGARDDVVAEVVDVFRRRHPSLRIAGWHGGYWSDDSEIVGQVRESRADMLFLAIPSPRKEHWLAEHLDALGVRFAMGVGGSFDVVAGRVRRAPRWVQRVGGEWLYRLAQEPRRLWRRYLVGNTAFVWLTIKELWNPL